MSGNMKDVAGGALLLLLAGAFAYGSVSAEIGTALAMGPGYFPLAISLVLAGVAVFILVRGLRSASEGLGAIPWRGGLLVLGAPFAFLLAVAPLGLVPAIFVAAVMCAFASSGVSLFRALVIGTTLTAFCYLVFVTGLGASAPAFGPLLRFG